MLCRSFFGCFRNVWPVLYIFFHDSFRSVLIVVLCLFRSLFLRFILVSNVVYEIVLVFLVV